VFAAVAGGVVFDGNINGFIYHTINIKLLFTGFNIELICGAYPRQQYTHTCARG